MASKIIVDQVQKSGLTALTLPTGNASASEFLQNDGAGALSWASASAGFADVHVDTSSGSETYTVPTDITKLLVIITGGGGSGSAGIAAAAWGGGGCSAGTVMARVTVVADDTITIEVGAGGLETANTGSAAGNIGGDSTFTHSTGTGSFDAITAPGGRAGVIYNTMAAVPIAPTVGSSNAGIAITGGAPAVYNGGASFWGQGGIHGIQSLARGTAGEAFGSGGGGGAYTAGIYMGSAGADGVCFIMEYK